MLIILNVYMLLMLPYLISINKQMRKENFVINGFFQNIVFFISLVINMPYWYFLFIKEIISKQKK
jgi:hypothetical protein